MSAIINVKNLTKSFGDICAVDHLSFTVHEKEVYGFLGENGAGKSTTIRALLTLIQPDTGEIEIFGLDLKKNREEILKRTGAIIEKPDLYKYLTAFENLKFFAAFSGIKLKDKQLMDQLHLVGLSDRANSKVKTYSQGMRQRLGLAVALVHDPELIILDEPMNGLDPQGIADVRNLIRHLSKDRGKTIIISSHLLNEMEQVADSLLIIHKGKKVVEGKMNELLNPEFADVEVETDNAETVMGVLRTTKWNSDIKLINGRKFLIRMKRPELPSFIQTLGQLALPVYSVKQKNSLEDYFLSVTAN
jgi:ABC-type multidrug transport system ATPase subunit